MTHGESPRCRRRTSYCRNHWLIGIDQVESPTVYCNSANWGRGAHIYTQLPLEILEVGDDIYMEDKEKWQSTTWSTGTRRWYEKENKLLWIINRLGGHKETRLFIEMALASHHPSFLREKFKPHYIIRAKGQVLIFSSWCWWAQLTH